MSAHLYDEVAQLFRQVPVQVATMKQREARVSRLMLHHNRCACTSRAELPVVNGGIASCVRPARAKLHMEQEMHKAYPTYHNIDHIHINLG